MTCETSALHVSRFYGAHSSPSFFFLFCFFLFLFAAPKRSEQTNTLAQIGATFLVLFRFPSGQGAEDSEDGRRAGVPDDPLLLLRRVLQHVLKKNGVVLLAAASSRRGERRQKKRGDFRSTSSAFPCFLDVELFAVFFSFCFFHLPGCFETMLPFSLSFFSTGGFPFSSSQGGPPCVVVFYLFGAFLLCSYAFSVVSFCLVFGDRVVLRWTDGRTDGRTGLPSDTYRG